MLVSMLAWELTGVVHAHFPYKDKWVDCHPAAEALQSFIGLAFVAAMTWSVQELQAAKLVAARWWVSAGKCP